LAEEGCTRYLLAYWEILIHEGRIRVRCGRWKITHEKNKHRPIPRLAAIEELAVVPPALVSADIRDIFDHLPVLELHERGIPIAFAVVFGQYADCFCVSVA
jgi:hypothetical protein